MLTMNKSIVLFILQKFQPDNVVSCCASQIAGMIEPAMIGKNRTSVELLATVSQSLFNAFPPNLAEQSNQLAESHQPGEAGQEQANSSSVLIALKLQARIKENLIK